MSSLIDQLNAAHDAGTLDTFDGNVDTKQPPPVRYGSRGRTSNPLGSGQMVSTKQSGFIPPEVAEAVMQANEEVSSGDSIGGTLAGVGVEMGVGIGLTYKLHRSARYLNWLNNAKRVATLGVVAPEPTTTAAGLVGVAATEAAIWGFSNFLGQSTRKAFGVQDAYSAGEMIASSVFGVGLVATGVDKLVFKLAPGVGAMNAWKGKELLVHGTKTFVSGAALGLAESTMRQELEHIMNGKDRNVYDYLFSAGAGGTFNSLFSMYARTGKWGRQQAAKAAEAGRLKLEADKATLKKQLTAATKGGAGQRNARIRKSIQEIGQAQDVIDDTLNGINKADEGLSKAEALTEPVAKIKVKGFQTERGDTPNDSDFLKAGGKLTIMSPDEYIDKVVDEFAKKEGLTRQQVLETRTDLDRAKKTLNSDEAYPLTLDTTKDYVDQEGLHRALAAKELGLKEVPVIVDASKFKAKKELEVTTPKAEEEAPVSDVEEAPKVETDRDKALNALTERVKNINSENFTQEQPLLELDVKKLYNEQETKRIDAIRRIADDGNDREALQSLLDEVVFTRKLNTQVKDRIETAGGRSVQAARRDAEKYRKTYETNPYSFRSMKEDAALAKLERTLRERLDGADTEDILNLYDDYLAIKPRLKKEGKAQDAKERKAAKRKKKIEEDTAGDLDKTDEEIEAELKEKAEKEGEKRLAQLREELEKQQEIFTRQRDEPEGKQPREKSDEELDLERRIKFYKTASREAKETVVLEEKLNKYLQLFREGDKDAIRQEVGPAPDWAKPAEVDSYLKRLRSLTNKVRKALKAEVTPKKVPTEAEKAAKLKEALKKKKATLQKQLDERRKRFGDDIELEQAQDAAKKPVKEEDPEVKDLQDRIKFYNQAEAEVATVERLEAQLARLADVEGRGVISELKDVTAPKPTGPTKPSQASIIRKKITASKKRMRDKLKDIDRVNEKEAKARIFADLENALLTSLETDVASRFTKFTRALNQARQLSLIDQLPSVMAGVPTGVGGIAKQFFRPAATFLYNLNKGAPVAWRLAAADGAGAFKTISTFFTKDNLKALKRTFSENVSATDTFYGKFSEDLSSGTLPQGEHAIIARAHANAKRQAEAVDNVTKKFTGWINTNNFWHILSLGVRSIQGLDEAFKRPLIKGRIWAESNKKAILEFPNNPMKARKRAEELYQSAWVDSNGLEVLSKTHEFYDEVNQVREELLFASNAEKWEDVYTPDLEDKIIGPLSRLGHSDSVVGFSLKAIMPYIGVPLRAVIGRGLRVAAGPLTVARAHFFNPYAGKIKEFKRQIEAIDEILRTSKDLTPESKKGWNAQIVEFTERMHTAQARALKFKGEALTDFFIGSSLMTAGAMHAASGDATGSLLWMTDDQRKKSGLNRFNSHNSNYAAAMPWSFPYAIGADVMMWWQLRKEQERTGEPLLTKEQDLPHVIRSSFVGLAREQPLTSGIKTAEELATGEGEVFTNALSRFLASYLSNPAQVRKVVQMLDSGGKVVDLRGASYWDRIAYHSLGNGPLNHKTDILGNDIESTKTWGTQAIMRQLPEKEKIRTELDKILATDLHQNVQQKPSMLSSGVKMTEYRNSDGLTLDYVFNKRLRETVIGRKTLEQAIDDLIYSSSWRKDFDAGWKRKEDNVDAWENEGLKRLNEKLQEYYTATRKQMTERKGKTNFFFLSDFVNKDGEYLDEVYERNKAQSTLPGETPRSVLDVLNVD